MMIVWDDADKYCQNEYGGHLASIHTDAEQQYLYRQIGGDVSIFE